MTRSAPGRGGSWQWTGSTGSAAGWREAVLPCSAFPGLVQRTRRRRGAPGHCLPLDPVLVHWLGWLVAVAATVASMAAVAVIFAGRIAVALAVAVAFPVAVAV